MVLIIGGYAQGKLEYVKNKYGVSDDEIYDFEEHKGEALSGNHLVFNNINTLIKNTVEAGDSVENVLKRFINNYPEAIIISDEVGNGIVPIDTKERLLRETVGKMQCMMAEKADEVIRVVCGIGQKLK